MKKALFFIGLAMVVLLVACGTDTTVEGDNTLSEKNQVDAQGTEVVQEVTIVDQLGETVVPVKPEKVVVFDFGILDSLDKLGISVAGVPQANIPPYLEQYESDEYVNVGSLKEPDFEAIATMDPDLIIISGRQLELADELNKISPTIYMGLDTEDYMSSFKDNMEKLGQIFDKKDEMAEELDAIDTLVDQVKEKATTQKTNGLVVLANEGNINAYGPGSRFGLIHDVLGISPVDENIDVSTHGMNVSYEYILERDPQYLFVIDRNAVVTESASAEQAIENELVQTTQAYKNNNIIYLDPNYWYLSGGGLVSVTKMIEAIDTAIE
ncbi:siderophore ABC transporter substrate-binding protein [Caldalkalibacillus salinus]|uniref:siderophore ABC transporter substrate-binding protein n=1 Tax=Caldalkalibacillus salinus TaxID=2803787 RepID=UPI001923BEA7|nr:siderophore ABC transporter substrate-binding protein [Caldalkalibacillus salinus]